MAISKSKRRELLALDLPAANALKERVRDYMARTGLNTGDLARRCGYAECTLRFWLEGRYSQVSSNDLALRASLLEFMEAHPAGEGEAPGSGERLYTTENYKLLAEYFHKALDLRRAYYVGGDPGTQKSFVLQRLIAELNQKELAKNGAGRRAYYVYCRQGVRPMALLKCVAEAAASLSQGDIHRLVRNLRFDFRGRRVLLVFDEAQHLDVPCLETVRELHDRPPYCGLLFAGSHELESIFTRNALALEQWNSRFYAGKRLPGLDAEESYRIVREELPWLPAEKAKRLVDKSRATHLRGQGEPTYISARRLFSSIHDLAEAKQRKESA